MKTFSYISIICLVMIIVLGCIIILDILEYKPNYSRNNISRFVNLPISNYEKDRTLLYGSLFLDKLNDQIKKMTDPRITYDDKRIDIIKYSDVLM
jgi:hypothetical protein